MAILFDSVPNISCVLVHVREHWGPIFSRNGKKVKDNKILRLLLKSLPTYSFSRPILR